MNEKRKIEWVGCQLTIDAAPFGYEYRGEIKLYKLLCVSTFPAGIEMIKYKCYNIRQYKDLFSVCELLEIENFKRK